MRERLPWQTLATGEHWYTPVPFQWACAHHAVDILQPDINWCGGATACRRIADAADAAGVTVVLHAGGNTVFGQHFSFALPAVPWCEFFVGSDPGIPLDQGWRTPGQSLPAGGYLTPNDAPGFGIEVDPAWIEPF